MPNELEQRALMERLYREMFKCRCGVIVSTRPVRGGSDTEGCKHCFAFSYRSRKQTYVKKPWPSFDAHVRTYAGLLRLARLINEGRDLLFEVARFKEGMPSAEIKRLSPRRLAVWKPSARAEADLMTEFEEAADQPVLDEIAREVEEAARRMFTRHGITWRDDRAMWLRLAEGEPEFQALCPILRGRPPGKPDKPALLRLIGRLMALGWSERAACIIAGRYADRVKAVEYRQELPLPDGQVRSLIELSEKQRKKLRRVLDFGNLPPWLRRYEAIYVSGLSGSTFDKFRPHLNVSYRGRMPYFETTSVLRMFEEGRSERG